MTALTLVLGVVTGHPAARGDASRLLVITGGILIDGTGRAPLSDSVIVIRDGRIARVAVSAADDIPPEAPRLDAHGKWIIPALIDAHVHYYDWMDEPFLRHGVTTVRDVGADLVRILEARARSRRSDAMGPRIFACGPLIDGLSPRHGSVISLSVSSEEEARGAAQRLLARGVDCLKVYEQLTVRLVRAIAQEAQRAGIPVTAHLRDTSAVDALTAGVMGLEHAFGFDACDEREAANVARMVVERNGYVVPTLVITAERNASRFPCLKRFVSRLQQLGGRVVAGSDTARTRPLAGTTLHRELELLVEAGLSPQEALRAATSGAADALGQGKNLGTIEVGKMADLVLLDGDPVRSIAEIRRVSMVLREGRIVWPR